MNKLFNTSKCLLLQLNQLLVHCWLPFQLAYSEWGAGAVDDVAVADVDVEAAVDMDSAPAASCGTCAVLVDACLSTADVDGRDRLA